MYTQTELTTISKAMIRYGGSFFKSIGEALQKSDSENASKLANAFPKEFEKYLNGWL